MSHKRPLDALVPEQEPAPSSPRKRLRRTVLVMMWLERRRRARAVTLEQMARQGQLDMEKLFFLLKEIFSRLRSLERLPEQFDTLERSVMGSIQVLRTEMQEGQAASLPNAVSDRSRSVMGSIQVLRTEMQEGQAASLPNAVYDRSRSVMGSIQVLRTEMQQRQEASLPNFVYDRSRQMPERLPETGSSSGIVELRFVDAGRPNDPVYTGSPVQWQNGQDAKVAIFRDGKQIKGGDLSKLQIEILPVYADFFTERGQEDFTEEEFSKQILMSEGKESVLKTVNLRNGEAYLGFIIFTGSSYRKKLRLTARVKRQDLAVRVQEAISDHFIVKVGRSKANEKSYPPMKEEPVHCLETICPKGKHCRYLADNNINTVKHLMRHYHIDKSGLKKLTGMKNDDWSTLIKHATTSDPGFETYSYRVVEENTELLFNDFYDLVGMMINGFYVPVNDLDHIQQHKANKWKMSAYRSFDERENSGGLTPDYFMSNGRPVREEPLNNDAGPSTQARTGCQYPNDITAHHEFRERHPFQHQNGFSPAEVLSNDDAVPSQQEAPLFSRRTAQQDLGQYGPSMPQNGTLYCHQNQGNILNGQGALSAQLTIPSNNFPSVQEGDLMRGACVTAQRNIYLSSLTTDAPGTSFSVADGVNQQPSSLNGGQDEDLSWSPQFEDWFGSDAHVADQSFVPANNAELPNSNYQLDDYEYDGGNL